MQLETTGTTLVEVGDADQHRFMSIAQLPDYAAENETSFLAGKSYVTEKFKTIFPEYHCKLVDDFDRNAWFFYSTNNSGNTDSLIRVCLNGKHGLPIQRFLTHEISVLESCGLTLAEPGRFSNDHDSPFVKALLAAIYQLAVYLGIDLYLMEVRNRHVAFYKRNFGAHIIGEGPASENCTTMAWNIAQTPPRFFRLFGRDQSQLKQFLLTQECGK